LKRFDNCGNTNTHTQVITVVDTEAPTFNNVPDDETVECDETIPVYTVTATDNCDDNVRIIAVTPIIVMVFL